MKLTVRTFIIYLYFCLKLKSSSKGYVSRIRACSENIKSGSATFAHKPRKNVIYFESVSAVYSYRIRRTKSFETLIQKSRKFYIYI
jgi:hypothetical protein